VSESEGAPSLVLALSRLCNHLSTDNHPQTQNQYFSSGDAVGTESKGGRCFLGLRSAIWMVLMVMMNERGERIGSVVVQTSYC